MAGIEYLTEFSKPALRGVVDATVEAKLPTFADRFLPNDVSYSTTFSYDIIKKSNHIAAMIGYGAEPPVIDRDAVATQMAEGAKMGLKYIATEEELLALNQARSTGEKSAMVDRLTAKGVDLVQALQKRIDVAKIEAIAKGTFNYNKNSVKMQVEYKIPAENKVVLTDDNTWANPEHDVIGDLLNWNDQYVTANGKSPDVILMTRETQALLLKNAIIVTEAGRPDGVTRVNVTELNSVLGGYGLPSIQLITERTTTVKDIYTGQDETIEFFPKNRVVMVSEGLGNFIFTPLAEANFQPTIDLRAYDKFEPIQSILRVAAAGFPVVEAPSLIFHADVFED